MTVAHPERRQEGAARLVLRSVSAATTSASERFVEVAGARRGHVLDPRTGEPAPAWGSVTVVAADPLVADLLSTALFVMGPDSAEVWAADREVGVLIVETAPGGLRRVWNASMERWIDPDERSHWSEGPEPNLERKGSEK